jgi:tetratricopeptide (TPR) repeat protein
MGRRPITVAKWFMSFSPWVMGWVTACTMMAAAVAAETNAVSPATNEAREAQSVQQILRACTLLQEQLRATQRAVEEARGEAREAARSGADLVAERFKLLEQALVSLRQQFEHQLSVCASTNADLSRQLGKSLEAGSALQHNFDVAEARLRAVTAELAEARTNLLNQAVLKQARDDLERELKQTVARLAEVQADLQRNQADLHRVQGDLQKESVVRRNLEQQAALLAITNADLGLQLARHVETESGLRSQAEKLEKRLEETSRHLSEAEAQSQQNQEEQERRAQAAVAALARAHYDLRLEQAERRYELEAIKSVNRSEWVLLGCAGVLVLVFLGLLLRRRRLSGRSAEFSAQGVMCPTIASATETDERAESPAVPGEETSGPIPVQGSQSDRVSRVSAEATSEQEAKVTGTTANLEMPAATGGPPGAKSQEQSRPAALLLAKGLTLLDAEQAEPALACFEEALSLEPGNTECLIKKGMALERLQRNEEAIASYDRALASEPSLTMAYLLKGAALNRLRRHAEAAECYGKALQARQKESTASPEAKSL